MIQEKILVVEDDIQIQNFMVYTLENAGFEVAAVSTGKDGIECMIGKDDYLTKPFSAMELMARIRVALRHYYRMNQKEEVEKPDDNVYTNGDICLDNGKHMVYKNGQEIHLTPMEYNLLYLFMQNPGKVLTYHSIL